MIEIPVASWTSRTNSKDDKKTRARLGGRQETDYPSQRQSFLLCKSCACGHAQSCPTLRPHGLQPARLLATGFSRQEYWSGLPFPPPGDLPDWRLSPHFLHLLHWQAHSLPLSPIRAWVVGRFSHVWLFATPRTVAHQAPLFMQHFWEAIWQFL